MRGIKHEWEQNIANSVNIQEAMGKRKRQKFLFIIARCRYLMGPRYCSTNELIIELLRSKVKRVGGCDRSRKEQEVGRSGVRCGTGCNSQLHCELELFLVFYFFI